MLLMMAVSDATHLSLIFIAAMVFINEADTRQHVVTVTLPLAVLSALCLCHHCFVPLPASHYRGFAAYAPNSCRGKKMSGGGLASIFTDGADRLT